MIRSYLATDLNAVIQLIKLNTPTYFHVSEEQDLRDYLTFEKEDYFVVELNGEIVAAGGINYSVDGISTARISWDVVHPNRQGEGIGKTLLLHRLVHLKALKNIKSVIIRTSQLVYLFYELNGFELTSVEKDYWAEGLDLYLMKKKLK